MKSDEQFSGIEFPEDEGKTVKEKANHLDIIRIEKRIYELDELVEFALKKDRNTDYFEIALSYYNEAVKELNAIGNLAGKDHHSYIANANNIVEKILLCAQKAGKNNSHYSELISIARNLASGVTAEKINSLSADNENQKSPQTEVKSQKDTEAGQKTSQENLTKATKESNTKLLFIAVGLITLLATLWAIFYSGFQDSYNCSTGDKCFELAEKYRAGEGVAKDLNKANSLYEKACNLGVGVSCAVLGDNYANGIGDTADLNKANSLYEKACSLDIGTGCKHLGDNYQYGIGVTKDLNKANSLYEKACSLDDGLGCAGLGLNYQYGNGVTRDLNKANSLYEKACRLGVEEVCKK